jgi:hypothetical protein
MRAGQEVCLRYHHLAPDDVGKGAQRACFLSQGCVTFCGSASRAATILDKPLLLQLAPPPYIRNLNPSPCCSHLFDINPCMIPSAALAPKLKLIHTITG